MTRGQGPFPFLNKKFKDFQGHIWDKDEADKDEWVQLCLWCEGRDWAGVKPENTPGMQKCPKTFVHDCRMTGMTGETRVAIKCEI